MAGLRKKTKRLLGRHSKIYLKQTISNKRHQELMSVPLSHQCSIFRCIHGSKIKHCYIWLPIVINCKIQGRQLVIGCKVSSFSGIGQQIALVHIFPTEEQLSINVVLQGEKYAELDTSTILSGSEHCSLIASVWQLHISQHKKPSEIFHLLQKVHTQTQVTVLPQTGTLYANTE